MRSMKPDPAVRVRKLRIQTPHGSIPALILSPKQAPVNATGVLWLHGGGYIAGMKEMVHMSRAVDLVKRFGAVVLSPGYRLALRSPYPAALDDCYASLLYLKANAASLGVRADQLIIGGESAGGGLCAAVCIRARDEGTVNVAFQMPLYPMLDDRDTKPPAITTGASGTHGATTLRGGCTCAAQTARSSLPMLPPRVSQILPVCRPHTLLLATASRSTLRRSAISSSSAPRASRRSWIFTIPICTLST